MFYVIRDTSLLLSHGCTVRPMVLTVLLRKSSFTYRGYLYDDHRPEVCLGFKDTTRNVRRPGHAVAIIII